MLKMKIALRNKLAALILCAGVVAIVVFLIASKSDRGGGEIIPPIEEKNIPDMPTFTIPISDIFKIGTETTFFFKIDLPSNTTFEGSYREASGMCINFFVLNETNMRNWLNDRSYRAYVSAMTTGKYNFTFTTDYAGTYYFVMDNREKFVHEPCQEKVVIFSLNIKR
ncbi:MAG: hypothetical protein ACUVTL_10240 [Thermoproteota archaeon]